MSVSPDISVLQERLAGQKANTQKLMQKAQLMVQAYRSSQPDAPPATLDNPIANVPQVQMPQHPFGRWMG